MSPFLSILANPQCLHPRGASDRPRLAISTGFQRGEVAGHRSALTPLANEASADREAMVGLANVLVTSAGDGWARIPYGEWPHAEGLQVFGRAEADEMVGYFRNGWNTLKRAISGLPIFKGHPDLADELRKSLQRETAPSSRRQIESRIAALENQYPDKARYGAIGDLEARADGLYLRPVLDDRGAVLVNEQGQTSFSPHWLAQRGPDRDGRPTYRPVCLLSIGLTDRPNIGGTSLVNSAPGGADTKTNTLENNTMPEWLLKLLGLEVGATEDQVKSKLEALLARPEPAALANEQSERTALANEVATLTARLATVTATAAERETALANERTAHAATVTARNEVLVAGAIREGRITEASKPTWLSRLGRDFATESAALANEQGALKTAPRTERLGDRKPVSAAATEFTALVNEALPHHGGNWTAAWAAVKGSAKGASLYAQMNAPAATA